jgi:pimeloyl-ACP methyl ester carboxylesterase
VHVSSTVYSGIDAVSHHYAIANGVNLHYVQAGQGDPVVLLAGWPQTWYAWRRVIPILAKHYTVIALDMRGLGDSDKPETGYDTRTIASDIHAVVNQLGWEHFFLVGHDVGAWAAYAYAATYPEQVSRLAVLDAAIPGITPNQAFQLAPDSKTWQFIFHLVPDLPEALTEGRERLYLSWFFRTKSAQSSAISDADIDEYVRCYSAPGAMQAGFAYYRAVFDDIAQNQEFAKVKLPMPVLALGGETATGMRMLQTLQTAADDVRGGVVPNCGHYIPEEQPEYLMEQLLSFFGKD